MKFIPVGSRLLVEVIKEEEPKTKSGIILNPESVKRNQNFLKGKVIRVGKGSVKDGRKETTEIKENDTIMFGKYVGDDIIIDGKKYLIMKFSEVICILD